MATYYVRTDGNDSNSGTGIGTGQAWATLGKALGATGIASGDTVYVKPGTYAESVTISVTPTVATYVIGDTDGAVFGSKGEVIWSGFLSGVDSAPTAVPCILNGKKYFVFKRITFYGDDVTGGNSSCVNATTSVSDNITIQECIFHTQNNGSGLRFLVPNNTSMFLLVERCVFIGRGTGISLDVRSLGTGSDWNSEIEVRNCLFLNSTNGISSASNVGTNIVSRPSHGKVTNCTFFGADYGIRMTNAGGWSTTNGLAVRNCIIYSANTAGLAATSSGQITSDYNRIIDCTTSHQTVTAGTNDISSGAFLMDYGAGFIQLGQDRDFFMPSQTMNPSANTTIQPSVDIRNISRTSTSTIGCYLDDDVIPATSGGGYSSNFNQGFGG